MTRAQRLREADALPTNAQLRTLDCARRLADDDDACIAPRRGQGPSFQRMVNSGLLLCVGYGEMIDGDGSERRIYDITEKGRVALVLLGRATGRR